MNFMFKTFLTTLLATSSLLCAVPNDEAPTNPKEALEKLLAGNERYVNDKLLHPNRSQERREALTDTQNPFATVIGCSDSRVSPTLVFDQGVGDIFEIRVAGNVIGPVPIASAEYSVKFLGSSLIMVLGHENCGAVGAVLKGQTQDIEPIADKIKEALQGKQKFSDNPLENAIKANVSFVVKSLRANPLFAPLIKDKKLEIVGGYYNLQSGKVDICCETP
jgi:carbonic anhydrase